ncbi:hypothetical protein H0H92_013445 [Tricholoma furcatifolium]|nr:hypothetical protein H0H92_013445 [Tricholoma furcatifolium]
MSSRDRLAAARARRQQQAVASDSHEMNILAGTSEPSGPTDTGSTSDFFTEARLSEILAVSSIQEGIERMNANVHHIATLHARILNVIDEGQTHDVAQLEQLTAETRSLSNNLRDRIKALDLVPLGPDAQMRKNRASFVRAKFIEAIQNYQRLEQEYRTKSRQRVERQLKIGASSPVILFVLISWLPIVKPDATPEEVTAVAEGGGQQIFAQALTATSRYGESRMAFREVQERQSEIKRMEETLAELALLFADMATLVEQQDETIGHVEQVAINVESDTGKA